MQVFDASSMIYAWDNYPVQQFPGLWEWLAQEIDAGRLQMSAVAFDEVSHKTPECSEWLRDNHLQQIPIDNAIIQTALLIKALLGIQNDRYHPKGVGENDILIIATAKVHIGAELISDEKRQTTLIQEPTKRKIPAVCAMPQAAAPCLNFIEYIKRSHAVFR